MPVTADWQTEIRSFLSGPTESSRLGPNRIDGLGNPPMKTADTELFGQDGSFPSPDYFGPRILIVDYLIDEPTLSQAMTTFLAMSVAWAPVNDATLIDFHFQLPGWGHRRASGRPRGLELVFAEKRNLSGVVSCIAEFHALVPTLHTVP